MKVKRPPITVEERTIQVTSCHVMSCHVIQCHMTRCVLSYILNNIQSFNFENSIFILHFTLMMMTYASLRCIVGGDG